MRFGSLVVAVVFGGALAGAALQFVFPSQPAAETAAENPRPDNSANNATPYRVASPKDRASSS